MSPDNAAGASVGRAFVLDDEAPIAAIVCKVLAACGITASQFTSPPSFLAELRKSPPDLIVLDLSLGQSDAVEVIRHLEISKYKGQVLLISGRDETTLNEITEIGQKHGLLMLPPLKKPFRPTDVKQRLAAVEAADAGRAKLAKSPLSDTGNAKPAVQFSEALQNNWLQVWYQPKFSLKTWSICGAEALIRAQHPAHGLVLPEQMLPPPGDSSYELLTKFVLERVTADWKIFAKHGFPLRLSINAPASAISTPAFVELLRSHLPDDPRFPGLTVEVTEDELIRDAEWAREIANQLKLYNVGLSIDDFGSGYASLSRLNELPFVELKLDRQFVHGCATNNIKRSLCQTAVDLGHRFDAEVCAEGVETLDDFRAVMTMQSDSAQGFLFAKPVPGGEFARMLPSWSSQSLRALLQAKPQVAQSA